MASDSQQTCARHSESTVRFDAEDRDACETLTTRMGIRLEPGSWMSENGTRFWNRVGRCSQIHSDDEYGTDFSLEQFAVGNMSQQCRSSSSFVEMVLLFPKHWRESERVSWKWNERR